MPREQASRRWLSRFVALAEGAQPSLGQALGNPRLAEARATVNATRTAGADTFAATVAPVIAEAQAAGAKSLRQIAAALNGRGVATARGGKWEAATVANVPQTVANVPQTVSKEGRLDTAPRLSRTPRLRNRSQVPAAIGSGAPTFDAD
jgi:hypothetical protein